MTTEAAHAADMERAELLGEAHAALRAAVRIAERARAEWDAAPSGMKAGKLLIALSGHAPGYLHEIDHLHALLAKLDARHEKLMTELAARLAESDRSAAA